MLRVRLFGQFCISCEEGSPVDLRGQKPRELLAYLLLHPKRAHRREALAGVLWGDTPTTQSKKYLRQALWQLQGVFRPHHAELLLITNDHVQLNPSVELWTDVAAFEAALAALGGRQRESFDAERVPLLEEAADLYRGELLDGWYCDWFLSERDRLHEKYLGLLERLLAYYAACEDDEKGVACAAQVLSYDRTREAAHRALMRFHHRAGDRAAALRQYAQCVSALREELDVEPSAETAALDELIRRDRQRHVTLDVGLPMPALQSSSLTLPEIVDHLQRAKQLLSDLHAQVQNEIESLERLPPLQARPRVNGMHRAPSGRRGSHLSS
jgi:DNA-binding SARP family transcriptional activator